MAISATEYAYGKIFEFDFDNCELPGKEYINSLNEITLFVDAVKKRVASIGYDGSADDISAIAKFILGLCKSEEINISRQNINNWLISGMPANTASGRENVYKLCFALKMNAKETSEFFLKAYLERPFNYKNINEAVYFFCMNNGKSYSEAIRIIGIIESLPVIENPNADDITEQIGRQLQKITTEEAFIKYISDNRSGFSDQNKTATEKIKVLKKACMKLAEEQLQITDPSDKNNKHIVHTWDELLCVIYGYSARATEGYENKNGKNFPKPVYKKSISKSNFPSLVRTNFPQHEQLTLIDKGKASYDVIRKTLIMLNFYHFYAQLFVKGIENSADLSDEFADEINALLSECGYVQLYWRNPYDWVIGYCAYSPHPLSELQGLIEEYYLNDPSVYNE